MPLKLNGDNSVSTPAFTGDDADTGLQCGTNELKLVTGGTEKVKVNDSNVRISYLDTDASVEIRTGTGSRKRALITKKTDAAGGALHIQSSLGTNARQINFITNSSGTAKVSVLADGGITFNGDTAAVNALDDYEEGTWTPSFAEGTWTYSTQTGIYTKIGNLVTATIYIQWTARSGSGTLRLNLPFSTGGPSGARYVGSTGYTAGWPYGSTPRPPSLVATGNGATVATFFLAQNLNTPTNPAVTDTSATGQFQANIAFMVD